MPEIRDRDQHEARLTRIVSRLTAAQRERLIEAMGEPPDVKNIPESLWREIEQEQVDGTKGYFAALFILSAAGLAAFLNRQRKYRTPPDFVLDEAEKWGQAHAEELAKSMATFTKERLEVATVKLRDAATIVDDGPIDVEFKSLGIKGPQAKIEVDPRKAYEERIESIFGRDRARIVGRTEVTKSTTSGEGTVKGRFENETGERLLAIWRHRGPKAYGKHPCPLCAPLVGTSETEWGSINPDAAIGPPLHPNCDCNIEYMSISQAEWKRQSWTAPRGAEQEIEDYSRAWKRIMNSLSPRDVR